VEREGSLRGQLGAYQRLLALQDNPIHVGCYLIKLVVVVTACLLSSISCLLFCIISFFLSSLILLSHSAMVRFTAARIRSFSSGARLSPRMSLFGWSRYPEVSIRGSEIQVKRRHGKGQLTKSTNPGSGYIRGCLDTGYTKSRTTPAVSFEGSIVSLIRYATLVGGALRRQAPSL